MVKMRIKDSELESMKVFNGKIANFLTTKTGGRIVYITHDFGEPLLFYPDELEEVKRPEWLDIKIPDHICDKMNTWLKDQLGITPVIVKDGEKGISYHGEESAPTQELPEHLESEKTLEFKGLEKMLKSVESRPDNDKLVLTADFSDPVSNPSHYKFSDFEPIKVIQAWDLSFALGNVVKYIARAGRKDSSKLIEDLEKAKKYLEFEIEHLRKGK